MTIDHAVAPGRLMDEIAEIDVLLMQYEDWRALLQLESREKQGDTIRSISGDTLKALLLESLSVNPLFARRQHLLAELEKMARDLQRLGPRAETSEPATTLGELPKPLQDDLSKISGIDARLAKRLNILNVRSFGQIAYWTPDDVAYVSNTLGLDNLIAAQDWIGQAARLVKSSETIAPAKDAWVHAHGEPSDAAALKAASVAAGLKSSATVPKPTTVTQTPGAAPAMPSATAAAKPVAAALPVSTIVSQPQSEVVVLADRPDDALAAPAPTVTPSPAHAAKPAATSVATAVPAAAAQQTDENWEKLVPATPLAARIYKTESQPAAAPLEAANAAPVVPESAPLKLPVPALPLAARHYQGAVLEPKHDGAIYAGLVPAKPLPAPAYRMDAPVVPAPPVVPVGAKPQAPPAAQGVAAQAASKSPDSKAADILQHTLPPLPLRPSAPPAQPPVQAQLPSQSPIRSAQPVAASAQSEALLLAVVAARSPLVSGAAPPPLPPQAKIGQTAPPIQAETVQAAASRNVSSSARAAQVFPAVAPPAMLDEPEPRSRQATVEARVTIKRGEDAIANTVLRTPGGTEVHLGARRASQPDEFDGASYAAYRGSIEEASVQIVRRPPATKAPDVPPPLTHAMTNATLSATLSAAQAAAHAAAQSATQAAAQASRPPAPDAVDSAPLGGATMGRFLKALTGQ